MFAKYVTKKKGKLLLKVLALFSIIFAQFNPRKAAFTLEKNLEKTL